MRSPPIQQFQMNGLPPIRRSVQVLDTLFRSLRVRLLVGILGMLSLLAGGVISNGYRILHEAMLENVRVSVKQTSQILNFAVSPYTLGNDFLTLAEYLSELIVAEDGNQGLVTSASAVRMVNWVC